MSKKALSWIDSKIRTSSSPYQICGGLAARAYGADRPLNDIDLFVPKENYESIHNQTKSYLSKPSSRYIDESEGWDVEYFQLVYDSVKIEIGNSENVKIFDSAKKIWLHLDIDYEASELIPVFGLLVPVMPKLSLLWYKNKLARDVDVVDVSAILQP